jgi:hypothetical protein
MRYAESHAKPLWRIIIEFKMTSDLSRGEMNDLIAQAWEVFVAHFGDRLETERARDRLEQIISAPAGQLSEDDRRAVAGFAERLIGAVWSESLSIEEACLKVENVANAAIANSDKFRTLINQ